MTVECIFCGEEIEPEPTFLGTAATTTKGEGSGYLFQCENPLCGAIYTSLGNKIPNIKVYSRPERDTWELPF